MTTLKDALSSADFAVTAELDLTPKDHLGQIVAQAQQLQSHVDAVQIPDHRNAQPHISPIAIAAELLQHGMDPVVRMNSRDRNRIAVQSELLTARSLGISNLLLSRGSDLPDDHRPPATSVYDLSAIDLIRTAAAIRDGDALADGRPDDAAEFFIGTIATVFKPNDGWQPEKLRAKADAGAQFVQLQPCMDFDVLTSYIACLVDSKLTWRFQVLANIAVLPSAESVRDLRQKHRAALIPSSLVARLEQARDAEAEGIAIAAELLQLLSETPGIAGANIHTMGDADHIVAAIEKSGVRTNANS